MELEAIIKAALFTPGPTGCWGLPIILWGPPGPGKTARIKAVARACGLPCEVLSPGERGEGAFGAIPVPRTELQALIPEGGVSGGELVIGYPPPEWAIPFFRAGGAGVVFVDELTTAPPVIQPALLGLIHDRRIGGQFLGPRVRVIAASNPVHEAAAGYELPAAVANRSGHITYPLPSVDEWISWLMGEGSATNQEDPLVLEARVAAAWDGAFAMAKGLVAGFLRARVPSDGSSFLHQMPKPDSPDLSRAWPSPRTCEFATRACAGAQVHGLNADDTFHLIAAFVGEGWAAEFTAYREAVDLPDPQAVLDGKVPFSHDPHRIDRTEAILASCTALVVPPNAASRTERTTKLWEILDGLVDADLLDLVALRVKDLYKAAATEKGASMVATSGLFHNQTATRVLQRVRPYFVSAGIIPK